MVPRASASAVLAVVAAAAVSLTCGEGSGPDPNAVARVVITPETGSMDTGDSLQLTAVARNANGADLSGKTFAWSTLDTTLVAVSGSGLVRARWPGTARVVSTSEGKADTARLVVIARIDSIAVTPALDTLRSFFDELTLSVVAYIGSQVYDGGTYTWERSDTAFLFLTTGVPTSRTATVKARKNGSTIVRVREARGASDSVQIVVRQQVAKFLPYPALLSQAYRACPVQATMVPEDARGSIVADAVLQWISTDTTLARVDSTGLITPLAVGTDTIVVTSDTASFRFPLSIEAAPVMPLFLSGVSGDPVATVGRSQYVIGQGKIGGGAGAIAPARYRIVSSDTSVAVVTPPDTIVSLTYPFFSEPLRIVGRNTGQVTLSPYLCDVPAPRVTLTVTRAFLKLIDTLPANARTDDDPKFVAVYTQDSAGVTHHPAEPLTVFVTTTDTTVMRADSSSRHVAVGSPAFYVTVSYLEPGTARLTVEDSAGVYVPDSSQLVQVAFPPLYLDRVGDTLHLGMRQHAFVAWDPGYVYVDRVVTGAPLHVSLPSSDSTVARITPGSVDIPVGNTGVAIDIASGDTRGLATLTAQAFRHVDARTVVVVGRPALQMSQLGGVVYPGDRGFAGVIAADSATQVPRVAAETVTVAVSSSDTNVIALDSATITIPAGSVTSSNTVVRFKASGTAIISATDPRAALYSYAGASIALTVTAPYLTADSAVSLGVEQQWGFGVVVNGPLQQGDVVRVAHRYPAVDSLADTVAALITPSFASVLVSGIAAGVDSVIASANGFQADTGIIVVGTGTSDVVTWPPFGLSVGQSWPLYLHILGPNGDPRISAVTKTFTLTANGNIEFIQDNAPITTVTVGAGQQSSLQFFVRGKAAGTGTVTISAPNYAPVTKSVDVTP